MRESPRLPKWGLAVGLILLFAAASPVAAGDAGVHIEGVAVEGSALRVDVANPGDRPATAILTTRVLTNDGEVVLRAEVTVPAGTTRAVVLDAGSAIREVTVLGAVLDDGSPF